MALVMVKKGGKERKVKKEGCFCCEPGVTLFFLFLFFLYFFLIAQSSKPFKSHHP